eukprot:CAMPEP_0115347118 /NCGR_PEP_ID=MMETSP0270-20121206/94705_1 /TAXON_ID=71861 /ORGANISM="Scrippsiella trochoidea, Strain CCMP3099" /LENGTH=1418 /DNA_ID=CAMNT_0002769009 /DNA_START=55 /DNA_END=4308 /DNA_ORIENTATION=-
MTTGLPKLVVCGELDEELTVEGTCGSAIGDWQAVWLPARPGPYEFRYPGKGEGDVREGPRCRIVVDPSLAIRGVPLPARAVSQLTVLSRCAGAIEKWPSSLAPQAELGYNMVHFTPIQPPGESGSCYSLDNQNAIDPTLMMKPSPDHEKNLQAVAAAVSTLEKDHGMLSAMDIVLNHTAGTAPWLLDHPECAYTVGNCPHLSAAAELDERLAWYSDELRDGRLGGPHIQNDSDVHRVMDGIQKHVLGPLNLKEYYGVDEAACLAAFAKTSAEAVPFEHDDYDALKASVLPSLGKSRQGVVVTGDAARRHCRSQKELQGHLSRLSGDMLSECAGLERDILEALGGVIRYERLECKKGPVGYSPHDAPFLWEHMTQYAVSMAKIFHAIRLDNAHSTPLHVSRHVLAQVRKANPHCWIFAELFTGNFQTDLLYQGTLGINALIRESMQCSSPHEMSGNLRGTLWGAHPIGAVSHVPTLSRLSASTPRKQFPMTRSASFALISTGTVPLRPRHCPALLFDCTHDNQTPSEKRDPRDALPNAALTAASCASIGSVRGYDELLPFNPSVVFERRLYSEIAGVRPFTLGWPTLEDLPAAKSSSESPAIELMWPHSGACKVVARGAWDGWQADVPLTKQSDGRWVGTVAASSQPLPVQYKFIVDGNWTCDRSQPTADDGFGNLNNVFSLSDEGALCVEGPDVVENTLPGILVVKQLLNSLHVKLAREGFVEIGVQNLADDIVAVQRRSPDTGRRTWFVARSAYWRNHDDGLPWNLDTLEIPGSIAFLHVAASLSVSGNGKTDSQLLTGLDGHLCLHKSLGEVAHVWREGGKTFLKLFNFPPGSILVFSTNPNGEAKCRAELDELLIGDVVEKPLQTLNLSELNYLLFSCEAEEQDRSGGARGAYNVDGYGPLVYCGLMGVCAALDLERNSKTDLLSSRIFQNIREGDWLIGYLTQRLEDMPQLEGVRDWLSKVRAILARFPRDLVPFHFDLAISRLCAAVSDVMLRNSGGFVSNHGMYGPLVRDLALAAGQLTERFAEARDTLLVYASVVRHGLCPNLLDAANRPRYNARDATWFFLQAIQDYVQMAPEGLGFLSAPVSLKWPVSTWDSDLSDLEPRTIADLIHLILSAHAKGIKFREWNAGKSIDEHMTDEGFNIAIHLEEDTGLVYGGNQWNCGTWMDKMGSSEKAGNKGVPATPRDGAPVEIIGLLKSVLRWVVSLDRTAFPHTAVRTQSGAQLTYKEWDERLQRNFERLFWVSPDEMAPTSLRCFYKDTVGATRPGHDYQLRPNFPIAMAVAPELFSPPFAQQALKIAAERLIGPLGMCTLDPSDAEYHGDYHNDDDSTDKAVAHGWNYHQGPEWVWPLGFFLRAWNHFCEGDDNNSQGGAAMTQRLLKHRAELASNPWRSLAELTNSKGSLCSHSCPAQAW